MPKMGTKTSEDLADEVQDAAEAAGDDGLSDMKTFAEQDAAAARLNGNNGAAPSPFAAMVAQGGEPAATDTDAGFEENAPAGPITLTSTPQFERGEVSMPRLRLGQGLTAEVAAGDAKMGQWIVSGNPTFHDEVTFVPLLFGRSREYRPDRDQPVRCSSPDGKQGYGDPGVKCAECPMAQWKPDPRNSGKNIPPPCTLSFNYYGYVPELEQVLLLSLSKTGQAAAGQLNAIIAQVGLGRFAVKLGSRPVVTGSRRYAVPTISNTRFTKELLQEARQALAGNAAGEELPF